MNDKAVYRTAPATPGLLIIHIFVFHGEGGRAYADKANKARGEGVRKTQRLADKWARGGLVNADIG